MAPAATRTDWDHEYNTLRRQNLFSNPPADHSAYPALQLAVNPHIEAFNAIFGGDGLPSLIDHALADVGTKTFFDGDASSAPGKKNRLTIRYKDVTLQKAQLPPTNKYARNREIYPSECRERHATYRGRLSATLEYRINGGDPKEFVRELGQVPIMIKV
jgi:DNA-directed RNA polymerase I subunit RPA2